MRPNFDTGGFTPEWFRDDTRDENARNRADRHCRIGWVKPKSREGE